MKYKINEIFYSVQGEGYFTGESSIFIRIAGCNLKCNWCDTDFKNYKELDILEILRDIKQYKSKHIVLTGGEPSIYDLQDLILKLQDKNYFIQIETNGSNYIFKNDKVWITCSPKKELEYKVSIADEIKLVVDKDFKIEILNRFNDYKIKYLQPEFNLKNYNQVVNIIKEYPQWRLSLQTHKLINIL